MATKTRKIEVIIAAKDQFTRVMNKMNKSVTSATTKIQSGFNGIRNALLGLGALRVFKVLTDMVEGFESALADLPKVTSEALGIIRTKIIGISSTLGTSTQLVKGYYQIISAGVTNPIKAMDLLKTAARASRGAHVDLSETVKALTKFMEGMKGEFEDATEASDVLFAIERFGQTRFEELVPVIGDVAKASNILNISSQELGGALAQVTLTAGDTAAAATQYRSVLTGLIKATPAMTKALKNMGFADAETAIKKLGLVNVLRKLSASTGGSTTALQKLFGRKEAILGFVAMAVNNFEDMTERIEGVEKAVGGTANAFTEWRKTVKSETDIMRADIEKFALDMEDSLLTVKRAAISVERGVLGFFEKVGKGLGIAVAKIAGADIRTALEKVNDEIRDMESPEAMQFFESAVAWQTEMNRLLKQRAALEKLEQDLLVKKTSTIIAARDEERVLAAEKLKSIEDIKNAQLKALAELEAAELAAKERKRIDKLDIARFEAEEVAFEAAAARRVELEENVQNQILALKFAAGNQAVALMSILGQKNKAFAVAALAFQKGLAIANVFVSTQAAAAAALMLPPIGLGPVAGAPLAASIKLWGRVQMGLIAATGLAEVALGGGGPSGIGGGGGVGALPITSPTTGTQEVQQAPVNVTINVNNPLSGEIADDVSDAIVEAIDRGNKRNVVINFAGALA